MTLKFSNEHVWMRLDDSATQQATVGITVHAQDALGDIVFVDLPAVGRTIQGGDVSGVVESVKAASDVFMPATGTVTEVNEALRADPSLANSAPLGEGWLFKLQLTDTAGFHALMDETAYAQFALNA